MPAFRFLGAPHPEVNVKDHNNPAFIALEKTLGKVQTKPRTSSWRSPESPPSAELDREWLQRKHIEVLG